MDLQSTQANLKAIWKVKIKNTKEKDVKQIEILRRQYI